ncbi:acid-sensing system DNA-binding response regulator EvgA [Serratia fonticola]|uniref:acid-sensing system DNA-binding response regulator EvgA n=1 Tax=Serratia fonticola TaxID=47917 RepID=UPI00211CD46D|nr:acid-sensing system DNA-binding response regulator EvgA [Serratia fonticola]
MRKINMLKSIIVDDHPLARMAIRNLLEKEGITIVGEAGDGAQALLAITQLNPDLIIVDVDIPQVSGIDVVEKLRKQSFSQIIIVVSAKNDLFYGKRSADAGANAFISKQTGMTNIIAAINAAMNGYSYFPSSPDVLMRTVSCEQQMLNSLSSQEIKVMRYILKGFDNIKIAEGMCISNKTVSTYKSRLMEKLNCKTLMDLFSFSQRNKIG